MYGMLLLLFAVSCASTYGNPINPETETPATTRCYRSYEEYLECGPACPPTCDTILSTSEPFACIALCVPGCFCKNGYVRNRWGSCIPQDTCPCTGPNEVYICGSACENTCDTLNMDCPIKNIKCNTSCYCKAGFARDKNGLCIPEAQCLNTIA